MVVMVILTLISLVVGIVVFAVLIIDVDADGRNVNTYTVPVYG